MKNALDVDVLEQILNESFPAENKAGEESYAAGLANLEALGVATADALRDIIKRHHAATMVEEKKYLKQAQSDMAAGGAVIGTSKQRTQKGVYFTHVGLMRETLRGEFGDTKTVAAMEQTEKD